MAKLSKWNVVQHSNRIPQLNPEFSRPRIVGYMSVDGSRNYNSDLGQLTFVNDNIPKGKISWDLNHNIDQAVKRTTEDNVEKIDLLLKFLLEKEKNRIPTNTFIFYRRTLIKIMYSAFNNNEPVCIRASLFKNHIYLHYFVSEYEIQRFQTCSDEEKKCCAWGYKFEQYMCSDLPHLKPNIDMPVVENAEFSLFYVSSLGEHKFLYGAQIDGMLISDNTKPPPNTKDTEEILNYLRSNQYVELKTNKEIQHPKQERSLRRYKMLRCWLQCFLTDLKGLIVGFRNEHGIVQRLQWYDTPQIVEYCKNEWDPQTTLNFLDYFLTFVKKTLHSYSSQDLNKTSPLNLDFYINVDRKIEVVENKDKNALLPDWYMEACNK